MTRLSPLSFQNSSVLTPPPGLILSFYEYVALEHYNLVLGFQSFLCGCPIFKLGDPLRGLPEGEG